MDNPYLLFYLGDTKTGSGIPIYRGHYYPQRGNGIGSLLSGLFRGAIPFIKPAIKSLGTSLLKAGTRVVPQVLGDVMQGAKIGDSIKYRGLQTAQRLVGNLQQRKGRKRKRQKGSGDMDNFDF